MLTIRIYICLSPMGLLFVLDYCMCVASNITTGNPNDSYNQIIDHSDIANDIEAQIRKQMSGHEIL